MLDIYAGKTAKKRLLDSGIKPELFNIMLGASGGPKWFTLFGLDKYLFGEFFKHRQSELNLIGSSAGAFRFAALCQSNPVEAISALAKNYSETVYSNKAGAQEISDKAKALLASVYGDKGISDVINNPIFKVHFIVAKCRGLTAFENKLMQMTGLLSSLLLNRIDRGLLKHQYQRVVYHHPNSQLKIIDPLNFNDLYLPLSEANFSDALLASGSIPLVMQGVKNIADSPQGMYRDGGIIDYHFDFKMMPNDKLVLYPHFNAQPKAGWFDKNLPRNVASNNYDNVVLLVPSDKFVNSLPYKKIPDRKDFTDLDANTRINYWKKVLDKTEHLAESLDRFIQQPDHLAANIKDFPH